MTSPISPQAHVRGQTSYSRPAAVTTETFAFIADLGMSVFLFLVVLNVSGSSLVPGFAWVGAILALHAVSWILQRLIMGTTFGETVWALRFRGSNLRGTVFRQDGSNYQRVLIAIFLTLLIWSGDLSYARLLYRSQPQWRTAESWKILPFLPAHFGNEGANGNAVLGDAGERWSVAPFFYALGAWPTTFQKKPVLYSIPYEKGPPSRFVGKIIARWASPDLELLFEGPKTPLLDGSQATRAEIRNCMERPAFSPGAFGCMRIRELALKRHFDEMRIIDPEEWSVKWFQVENPALPAGEQVQGIFLRARTHSRQETRYILITPRGTHQAIILKATRNPHASGNLQHAEHLLESSIGSLRISDSLDAGRAWIDRQLSSIRMDRLPDPSKSHDFVFELARIQSLLVSKISVEPKIFDAYYHLAGAAWLLIPAGTAEGRPDWTAAAVPLLESLYRYGQDVLPLEARKSKRMQELENLWLEAKKLKGTQ